MVKSSSAAQRLSDGKDQVLYLWEQRSRATIQSARDKDSHTVRNELIHFLGALVENLRVGRTKVGETERISAEHHGQQRAGLTGYTLMETVTEYGLLRKVLITFLLKGGPLTELDREVVHETVDNAVQLASTEFAQAEKAKIKLALAKAETSNRDLEHVAAVAAHDLRSPLITIAGFTDLLQEEFGAKASDDAREWMAFITSAVGRMTSLIDGILSYAKLNEVSSPMESLCADEPVNAATQNLKAALTESSGRISHGKLPDVDGNFPMLTQVFQNLFSNSIKYRSQEPPVIEVSAESHGAYSRFEVRDNGIGFDLEFKDVIFNLHKQLDTDRRLEGSGLGLATCRRVIEYHGGRIWAESVLGQGSTFYFTLPNAANKPR